MEKKIFITDFDGTLLNDEKNMSNEDFSTLSALKENHIVTVIATGRSLYSFNKTLKLLTCARGHTPFPVDYVIFSTGAGIIDFSSGSIIHQNNVDPSDIEKITHYFDQKKYDYMVHRAIPDTKDFLYRTHGNDNPDFQSRMSLYRDYARPMPDGYHPAEAATEVLAILPGKTDRDLIKRIQKDLSEFSVIHATSPLDHQSAWIEVFHKDVSKAKAASWLAEKLGAGRQDVISLGNDYNDQDLLSWSGQGYVVENAPDSLKRRYTIVPSNNHSGLTMAAKISGLLNCSG